MSNRWDEKTVIELQQEKILFVEDGNHGAYRPRPHEFGTGEWAFIRASDMNNGRILFESAEHINATSRDRIIKGVGAGGDVLLSHKGTVGKLALAPLDSPVFVCSPQTTFWRCLDLNSLDRRYLYYFMMSENFRQQLNARKGETDMADYVSLTAQRELKVVVPPIEIQRSIARILGVLDDKIELNRHMNHTLESMAQTLFREWFVDNEDVETWDVVSLPEIIEVNPHRSLKKGDVAPYLDMANMPTHGHRGIEWIDRPFGSGTKFINGDTLLARITPCLENGKTAFVDFLKDDQVGWGSTEYIIFRPKPPLPPEYGYYLARSEDLRNHAIQNMIGTSGRQRTPASSFDTFTISAPPIELARKFGAYAKSVISKVRANDNESRTLASIRDALLPKLLSGELRVKPAEKVVQNM